MEIQARPVGGMDLRQQSRWASGQIQNMFEFFQLIRCGMRKRADLRDTSFVLEEGGL